MAGLGKRIQLAGERRDFIQEYAVNDRQGRPLWYAHFHYPEAAYMKFRFLLWMLGFLMGRASRKNPAFQQQLF